jgi:DNA-binding beta-propeller fold protein YncE
MPGNLLSLSFLRIFSTIALVGLGSIAVATIISAQEETQTEHEEPQPNYTFVKKWGSKGTGDGQFQRVHDLDFDPSEKYLYVTDRDNHRVQVFDKNGKFLFKWGSKGTGDGQFTVPYSVDVDSHGNVWVTDRGNHRIQKFDKDGNFLFKFGSKGSKEGEFKHPSSML